MKRIIALLVFPIAFALAPAHAETTLCTEITSLPATITTQGMYCLHKDLSTNVSSGTAIDIRTNNVTLDCNNWKAGGLAAGLSTNATGIQASGRQNITIRNCGVRGFRTGISLSGGAGHLIEDNRVDNSTVTGIYLMGDAVTVRSNRIIDTGGRPGSGVSYGIEVNHTSSGALISDNQVINVTVAGNPNGNAFGMRFGGIGHEISRNLFVNIMPAGTASAYGTYGAGGSLASLRDNTAINSASTPGVGIEGGTSASQCRDNMTSGFITPLAYCVDVSGNAGS